MRRETIGKVTVKVPMHRMPATTLAVPTPTTSDPAQFSHSRIRDRRQETCNRTVFKAHRPAQTHLNTRHHPRHQDRPHRDQVHRRLRVFHLHLRTLQARLTMVQPAVVPLDLPPATVHNSDDLAVPDQHSAHNSDREGQITSVVRPSWDRRDRLSTDKAIPAWADPDT
jgi:hypothetical protein